MIVIGCKQNTEKKDNTILFKQFISFSVFLIIAYTVGVKCLSYFLNFCVMSLDYNKFDINFRKKMLKRYRRYICQYT